MPSRPEGIALLFVDEAWEERRVRVQQKWQYAIRAVFELAKPRATQAPIKIADIARAQHIPVRFLEVILNQLRHAGILKSRRGSDGGYLLARPASELTVGQVLRSVERESARSHGTTERANGNGTSIESLVIQDVWTRGLHDMWQVYDSTTFEDLLADLDQKTQEHALSFSI